MQERTHQAPGGRLALFSTPWPFFDRPSIQMGSLKAFLKQRHPDIRVDTHHIYLKIASALGYPLYRTISERSWVAESPYAALLYPDRMENVARFWYRKVEGHPPHATRDFRELCSRIKTVSLSIVEQEPWDRYSLLGFSICLAQLSSSLYFIREIKRRAPRVPIVAGGSACAGALGESLIQTVPQIDYVIQGEGELPLLQLMEGIMAHRDRSQLSAIPGLICRDHGPTGEAHQQIPDLDELPIPDYSDYFRDLECLESRHTFLPRLPMEMSRGCWWSRGAESKRGGGCTFCNLNLQWSGYRQKSGERTVQEIETLIKRHQLLSIYFMDNLLPPKGLKNRFHAIQRLGKDLHMFAEMRAKTSASVLDAMAGAGMDQIQVGVEALSTTLLKKFNKGTTAMDNLEIMKNCERPSLPDLAGNLILNFPTSDSRDVAETLRNLAFALPFRPLKGIPLWLGYGSPLWRQSDQYQIRLKGNHPNYRHIFPSDTLRNLRLMIQGYHGGVRHQQRIWKPVREKLSEWRHFYERMHQRPGFTPILSYRDGKDFLIIHERRLYDDDMTHRLTGHSRAIYLFCEVQRSMADMLARFPRFSEDQIRAFLRMMVDKRLMFSEGDRYLSLAVPP